MVSCRNQTHCPEFSGDDMEHFPYRSGDTLCFVNADSEYLKLVVPEISVSDSYCYECNDLNGICNCERYAEARFSVVPEGLKPVLLKLVIFSSNQSYRYYYSVYGFEFELDFENEAPYVYMMPEFDYLGNYVVSDSMFTKVYRAINLNYPESNVQHVFFSKNAGIIRIDEKQNGNIWQLKP